METTSSTSAGRSIKQASMSFTVFKIFTKIGMFTIGGGHAVIPLIEKDVVSRGWLSKKELNELISITDSLPGVFATNLAALVGYKINGFKGSLFAALGTIVAPFLIIILLALFFREFQNNLYVSKAFKALRPAVVALILAPCFTIIKVNKFSWKSFMVPLVAFILMVAFSFSPVLIVVMGCIGGLIYFNSF